MNQIVASCCSPTKKRRRRRKDKPLSKPLVPPPHEPIQLELPKSQGLGALLNLGAG